MAKERTALLVRCSEEEATAIREAARRERRTISGFILNAVLNRIANQQRIDPGWQRGEGRNRRARAAAESVD
jgi:uncharacterized protein (DUF1778 family)